jgi:hypothetical protein
MEQTVVAHFETRRAAEIAVEHLVQEHGIDRSDIFIRAPGSANTSGTRAAGADVESGHPGVEKRGDPELSGPIEVSVDCHDGRESVVKSVLQEAGATQLQTG